jgi:hypothetical protein
MVKYPSEHGLKDGEKGEQNVYAVQWYNMH